MRRRGILLGLLVGFVALATAAAHAAWTSSGSGAQYAKARSIPQGATPTVSVSGTNATVSWAATSLSGGGPAVSGYVVRRFDAATLTAQTVGAGCSGTIAALSCVESNVPAGTWRWSVQPKQSNWLGAESAKSASSLIAAYRETVLSDSPLVYFRLDETSGTVAADSSGNGYNATYQTQHFSFNTAGAVGDGNKAITAFGSGTPAFISPGGVPLPTGNAVRSWEAWFKTTTPGSTLISWGDANNSNPLRANGGSPATVGISSLSSMPQTPAQNDNQWHHVVATYDGNIARSYFDGAFVGQQSGALNTPTPFTFRIGNDGFGFIWQGSLDEIAVYPTVLSAARVLAHFEASGLTTNVQTPTNFAATPGNRQVALSWTASTSTLTPTYVIEAYLGSARVAMKSTTSTTTTFTGLDGGAQYSFTIYAYSGYGTSVTSSPISATTSGTGTSYRSTVMADNPIGYWRLDQPIGQARAPLALLDYSGYARNLTYGATGLTRNATGAISDSTTAVTTDSQSGIGSGASTGLPTGGASRTMEIWIKTTSPGFRSLMAWGQSQDSRLHFDNQNGTKVAFSTANGTIQLLSPVVTTNDNAYHHVVFTYDQPTTTGKIYYDGVQVATGSFSLNTSSGNTFYLGNDRLANVWFGQLDEAAVYDYALNATRIAAHYAARL